VVGDHGPGIAAATTCPGHGFERRLAVGMTGVPVTGAAQPLRMEILPSSAKGLCHFNAAEIALAGGTATRVLTAPKTFDGGLQRIFTSAGDELRNQGFEPVRCFFQQFSVGFSRTVESGVTGAQQRQTPVTGRLGIRKREQRLGKGAVGGRLMSHQRA